MTVRAVPSRLGAIFMTALFLATVAALIWAAASQVRGAEKENWTPVTLLYHSDVKGKIEPCG